MTDDRDRRSWTVHQARARGIRRPDGRWFLRLPAERTDLWTSLIDQIREDITDPLLITTSDGEPGQRDLLVAMGFTAQRIERLWRIPVASIPERPIASTAHRLLPLDRCDLPRVVELDNAIRADIPGTETWSGTLEDLQESLADDEFDPELYLIAEHTVTDDYDGLIRLWNRTPRPRIGCLGVRVQHRRTRLTVALIRAAAAVLRRRGVNEVITETDTHNVGSHRLAARHGTSTGEMTEWELAGPG